LRERLTKEVPVRTTLVFVALAVSCGALASSASALGPTVSSHQIGARERPVISFTAGRRVAGNSWYEIHLAVAHEQSRCEIYEELVVSYTFPGERVRVRPKPWDAGRWCPGRWRGRIYLFRRRSCRQGGDDGTFCQSRVLFGSFWFRVVR
jgi:hypothetical protein